MDNSRARPASGQPGPRGALSLPVLPACDARGRRACPLHLSGGAGCPRLTWGILETGYSPFPWDGPQKEPHPSRCNGRHRRRLRYSYLWAWSPASGERGFRQIQVTVGELAGARRDDSGHRPRAPPSPTLSPLGFWGREPQRPTLSARFEAGGHWDRPSAVHEAPLNLGRPPWTALYLVLL